MSYANVGQQSSTVCIQCVSSLSLSPVFMQSRTSSALWALSCTPGHDLQEAMWSGLIESHRGWCGSQGDLSSVTCLPRSCAVPSSRNEASCSAVGIWGQSAEGSCQHWEPRRPLLAQPYETSSLCLTPSQPISHHFLCLFIATCL